MKLKYYLKKKYNQFRFNLCANENPLYLFFYKYLYCPPKNSLSEFLDKYSKKNAPLTFLQIGANDGFIYDPIQKFIKRDNWKGIMLEPQPIVFKQYLTKIHAKRKEILQINADNNVVIISDQGKAFAKRGIYFVNDKIIELYDNVKLEKEGDILVGDKGIFNVLTGKGEISIEPNKEGGRKKVYGIIRSKKK